MRLSEVIMVNMLTGINTSIYNYMRAYRQKNGESIAVICGSKKLTFNEFFKKIDRVASGISALGIKRGDVVMSTLPAIMQNVVLTYAAARIGAIVSPVHPLISKNVFQKLYSEQKPKILFVSEINMFKFGRIAKCHRILCPFGTDAFVGLPLGHGFTPFDGDGTEPAFYMHSGGTTGSPKTVVLSSRAVNALTRNLLSSLGDGFDETDKMLVTLPLFHGFGMCVGVHSSLSTNMSVVLMPKFSGENAVKNIKNHRITTMIAIPRMLTKLLALEEFKDGNISLLKEIYVGGDTISPGIERAFNRRLEESGAKARISAGYGLTEVGSVAVVSRGVIKPSTVGLILDGMRCKVVGDDGVEAPVGEVGELYFAGDQLMSGYLGDAVTTNAALVSEGGEIWLKTGDYFKIDAEGYLTFMGRKKRLFKISGMSVFPSEIERVAGELPFVKDCAACEVKIKGKSYIKLFHEGEISDSQKTEIITCIKNSLPHWYTPSSIVCLDKIPRTSIGKIDIKRLSDEFSEN